MKYIFFFLLLFLFNLTSFDAAAQTINNVYGDLNECDTMTRGIFIVWWDSDYNFSVEADVLLDSMLAYRSVCLIDMGMMDPPNPLAGYYYNVYIHTGNANDHFTPYSWGNGQGTDSNGYPFLTLPSAVLNDWLNNAHETFHVFQYNANAPGFAYSGDSQWYIEASANWFAAKQNPGALRAFIEAESLVRIPQVPLWLSYNNYPASYPNNWQRYVHQYALALYLYYLTDAVGVNPDIITAGMYSGTSEMPQEYMYNLIGASAFRQHFIDWAAHMTNDFDFITPQQAQNNLLEWNAYADLSDDNEFIDIYTDQGSNGWVTPNNSEVTNAWSFNVFKIENSLTETYNFELRGQETGNYGDPAYFQGKVVVLSSTTGASFHDLTMTNDTDGYLSLSLTPNDTAIYYIIASMPEKFEDGSQFQLFPYEMQITTGTSSIGIMESEEMEIVEVARYTIHGQIVERESGGVQLVRYSDGTVKREFVVID